MREQLGIFAIGLGFVAACGAVESNPIDAPSSTIDAPAGTIDAPEGDRKSVV